MAGLTKNGGAAWGSTAGDRRSGESPVLRCERSGPERYSSSLVLVVVVLVLRAVQRGDQDAGVLADLLLDRLGDLRILPEIFLGVLAALAAALAVVGEPRARLLDHARLVAEVDQLADLGNALAVHDVELDHLERRRDLVLHHLHAGLVADHVLAVLDRADAADVEADRGV